MKRSEIKLKTHRNCKNCGNEFKLFRTTDKYCSNDCRIESEGHKEKKVYKAPNKVSDKRKVLNEVYSSLRIKILSQAKFKCFIDGCTRVATTLEHRKGRKGYADDFARENDIPLLIDERYLAPCCFHHNQELENNPELSKKYQLSKIHNGEKL